MTCQMWIVDFCWGVKLKEEEVDSNLPFFSLLIETNKFQRILFDGILIVAEHEMYM